VFNASRISGGFNNLTVFICKRTLLVQDFIGNANFSNVMQDGFHFSLGNNHRSCNDERCFCRLVGVPAVFLSGSLKVFARPSTLCRIVFA